jgi:Domain of unknown function (DUF4129)
VSIISRLKNVNWIADVLTPSAVILMEGLWLYPWLVFIGKERGLDTPKTHLSLPSLICVLGLSYIATKIFLKRKWPMLWIQTSIIACGLVVIFLVLRIEYNAGFDLFSGAWFVSYWHILLNFFTYTHPFGFALIASLYFWWRGINLGRSPLDFEDIYRPFLIELATLVFLIILWVYSFKNETGQNLTLDIGIYIAGFFFFGLVALALSNLVVVQERMKIKGESSKYFGRRWLTIILSVIGGIFLISIGFASIFSTQFIAAVGRFLKGISAVYDKVVTFIIYAIGYLVQILAYIYQWIINLFRHGKPPEPPQMVVPGDLNNPKGPLYPLPPWVLAVLKLTLLALVLLIVIFLIIRAVRRRHRIQTSDDLEEEHESLWSWGGFKSDIILFFKMLFQHFKRKPKPIVANVKINWQPEEDIKRRLSIREIYQHLLWQGERLRIPREDYETPSEYARRLGTFAPDSREPLNEITGLYIDVRYGEKPIDDKKTDDANTVWQRLLNILKGPEDQ